MAQQCSSRAFSGFVPTRRCRHTFITELAEMGVADHVVESICGHLSRRMLEHYSHIRIDAKRQVLDALDAARRAAAGNGSRDGENEAEIEAVVEVADDLTSQSRHSLRLSGSPPSGKLLIPSAFARQETLRASAGVAPKRLRREGGHLNGEMSEWLKEHAWKAKRANDIK
jgi:sirohydrochlorin ferrochelatase